VALRPTLSGSLPFRAFFQTDFLQNTEENLILFAFSKNTRSPGELQGASFVSTPFAHKKTAGPRSIT
jgi:hypothetical protein